MLAHILVATDLSHRSDAAAARAGELAARFGAALTLLHVVEQDQPTSIIAQEMEMVRAALEEQALQIAQRAKCKVHTRVEAGDPFQEIGAVASQGQFDLIVIGRHRKRPLRDMFIGTTAERVIWHGTHPVLLVKTEPRAAYHRVGIAIDGSAPSAEALRVAEVLGLLDDAKLRVVHAREPFAKTMLAAHANREAVDAHVNAELDLARNELISFLEGAGRADLSERLYIDDGAAIDVLHRFIEQDHADLLVMGTHERSGISRFVLGSVTEEALRSLEIDILAVPPSTG